LDEIGAPVASTRGDRERFEADAGDAAQASAQDTRACTQCGASIAVLATDCPSCRAYQPVALSTFLEADASEPPPTTELILRAVAGEIAVNVADGEVIGREATGAEALQGMTAVSRRHCRFDRRPSDGVWLVMDLGSANGTHHGGERLEPGVGRAVEEGDRVLLADVAFVLEIGPRGGQHGGV